MKKILKNILPPFFIFLITKIYFFYLIKKNKLKINENYQDIHIYGKQEIIPELEQWGKNSTWNEIILLLNSKRGKILDIACGTGQNILDLKIVNPEAEIYGCDISNMLIDVAIRKGIRTENLRCLDATKLDYQQNFFDYSFSIGSLEHFTESGIDSVLQKAFHVTKIASFHMVPVSNNNINHGWIKTYQTFHNNSTNWWVNKFKKKFTKVYAVKSSWKDFISNGMWFLCYK